MISALAPAGTMLKLRSDEILKPGNAGDIIFGALTKLGLAKKNLKTVIMGYDHGASIALRMASKWPYLFTKIVAFHPNLMKNDEVKRELSKITAQVLV